jgi:Response regulator containing a CheY-like receiver domain and an HD-GYP domain
LTLVKSIVEAHHGKVQLIGKENKGVSVIVSLQKGNEHFDEESLMADSGSESYKASLAVLDERIGNANNIEGARDEVPSHTLLVVDDDHDIRKLLVDIFHPTYKIIEASNGEEALVIALEKQPDVILSDVMMPVMAGTELCEKIKRNLNTSHIPVVLITAKSEYENVVEGLETGADEYISKPFDIQLLQLKVKNLIQNRINIHKRYSKEPGMAIVEITRNPVDQKLLEMARDIILKNIDNPAFDVNLFAQQMGLGRTRLFSKIKSLTGQTPNDYIMSVRLKRGADLLQGNEGLNVSEVAYTVGFSNPRYFSQCFRDYFGVSPSKFCKTPDDGLPEKDE